MVLRQCVSLPAALTSRSWFTTKEWFLTGSKTRRGFQSATCSSNPRLARLRANAAKKNKVAIPPPVISLTSSKTPSNVYRDFSDGDDEPGDEKSVIELNSGLQVARKKSAKPTTRAVKRVKPVRKQLRFSDSEDEDDVKPVKGFKTSKPVVNQLGLSESEGEEEEDDDDEDEDDEDEHAEGDSKEGVTRKGMVGVPQEASDRGILYEQFIPQHLEGKRTKQLFGSNIHIREGLRSLISRVEFIKSSSNVTECPRDGFPEFAFVGRSNVGKSSLVNLLVERRKLALVSKKPGKTQLINHFLVNKTFYLVDLPGYGYAVAPKSLCVEWNEFTREFFLKRTSLVMVILLVDAAIPPQQIDIDCATWLKKQNIPTTLAFTKCDKRKKKKRGGKHVVENVVDFLQKMRVLTKQTYPWVLTSCLTGQGREELLLHMEEYRKYWHS